MISEIMNTCIKGIMRADDPSDNVLNSIELLLDLGEFKIICEIHISMPINHNLDKGRIYSSDFILFSGRS